MSDSWRWILGTPQEAPPAPEEGVMRRSLCQKTSDANITYLKWSFLGFKIVLFKDNSKHICFFSESQVINLWSPCALRNIHRPGRSRHGKQANFGRHSFCCRNFLTVHFLCYSLWNQLSRMPNSCTLSCSSSSVTKNPGHSSCSLGKYRTSSS